MSKSIAQANAKSHLEKINDFLEKPHVIIGGLAVQQYVVARRSVDIDLICDSDTATEIIDSLFPLDEYISVDENDDEYRPAFVVTPRIGGEDVVLIGPKILEREPYRYLTWNILEKNAQKFRVNNNYLENILVPSSEALAYTKFLSFLTRIESNPPKGEKDLKDFVNLTNHQDFNLNRFVDIVRNSGSIEYLQNRLFDLKGSYDIATLKKSPLLFGQNTVFSGKKSSAKSSRDVSDLELFTVDSSPQFYDRISRLYDIRNSNFLYTAHQKTVAKLREILGKYSSPRVLDIGAGTGRLIATHFSHRPNLRWTALDASENMNNLFAENIQTGEMSFDTICCDANDVITKINNLDEVDVFLFSFVLTSLGSLKPLESLISQAKTGAEFVIADIHPEYTKAHPYYDFVESDGSRLALEPNPVYSDKLNALFDKFGGKLESHSIIVKPPDKVEYAFLTHYTMHK